MGTAKKIILGVVIVLLVSALAGAAFVYAQTQSSTRAAFLAVEQGSVQVDSGNGWMDAMDGLDLGAGARVRTLDGLASVILFESVIVNLEPNTEVSVADLVQEHPVVRLESGEVWTKFTGLLGVESFDVQTPTTVATVRGTEYGVSLAQEVTAVLVAEGVVVVSSEGESVEVRRDEIVEKLLGESMLVRALNDEERARLAERRGRVVDVLRRVRADEIEKNRVLLRLAERQGVTRADIEDKLADLDEGRDDVQRVFGLVPVETASVTKVRGLTEVIREQIVEISEQ